MFTMLTRKKKQKNGVINRNIISVLLCLVLLSVSLCGCEKKKETESEEHVLETYFNSMIDKEKKPQTESYSIVGEFEEIGVHTYRFSYDKEYDVMCHKIYLSELVNEKDVSEIEYEIDNCVGGIFVDNNESSAQNSYTVDSNFASVSTLMDESNRKLSIQPDIQNKIYLMLYGYHNVHVDEKEDDNTKGFYENMIISVKIHYSDGTTEERKYYTDYRISWSVSPGKMNIVSKEGEN